MHEHLLCVELDRNYTRWVFHGECGSSKKICDDEREKFSMRNDLDNLLEETFMFFSGISLVVGKETECSSLGRVNKYRS